MNLDNLDLNKSGAFIIGLSDCGEKITSAGGRVSTQEGTVLGIWQKSQDCEKNAKLIDKVTRSGHNSVVEHTYFNLAFQNVTAVVEQFVIEFRLASFTVKSRRYVDFSDAGFLFPRMRTKTTKAIWQSSSVCTANSARPAYPKRTRDSFCHTAFFPTSFAA